MNEPQALVQRPFLCQKRPHMLPATSSKKKTSEDKELQLAKLCAALAKDKKADNVVILDVASLTSYADYFVICSAPSERQVSAIAKHSITELKEAGYTTLGVEGMEEGTWVLADFGSVIFHTFVEDAREYYNLENFWREAKRVEI